MFIDLARRGLLIAYIEELMGKYVDKEGNALPLKRERKESKHVTDWRNLV